VKTINLKELRNALSCWQDDYDCDDDKEQYDMFGAAIDAVSRLEAAELEIEGLKRFQELNLKIKQAMHERFTRAERERDELRAEQAEHDEQIARMESKFSLAKRALDSKTARCEKAEAELRRRDPAAGGVSCQHKWMNSQGRTASGWLCEKCGDYERPIDAQPAVLPHEGVSKSLRDWDWSGVSIGKKAVICAAIDALGARPAVLPPAMTYAEALKVCDWKNDQASIWVEGANWMRQQCLELGAQQQKVVEFPKPHAHLIWIQAGRGPDDYWDDVEVSRSPQDRCCDGSDRYAVYSEFEVKDMLDAAGVKWEVKT